MSYVRGSAWTEERHALLSKMHKSPPKAIWEALNALPGPAITKQMVIGMRDRNYMTRQPKKTEEEIVAMLLARRKRQNEARRAKRAKTAKRTKVNFNRVEAAKNRIDPDPFIVRLVDVDPMHINLESLSDETCRYPFGDGPYTFCGHSPKAGSPYCGKHHGLCYTAPPARTKAPYVDIGKGHGGIFGRVA